MRQTGKILTLTRYLMQLTTVHFQWDNSIMVLLKKNPPSEIHTKIFTDEMMYLGFATQQSRIGGVDGATVETKLPTT